MVTTAFGIIVLGFPFLLVFLFSDRARGILCISTCAIGFGIVVALLAQSLHIFTYPIVLSIYIIADLGVFAFFLYAKKVPSTMRLPIFALVAFCIISFELFSVHYHYTGTVQTTSGTASVKDSSYAYPTFSDEWVEAALAHYSIESGSLPAVNPLAGNVPTANLLLPFDSSLALLFLVLGLSPVADFAALSVAFGLALCAALYLCMRSNGISRIASLVSVLSVPFITNGANLPGIWFLLPYTASAIAFFIMLAAFAKKERAVAAASAIISIALYPPMAVFILPAYAGALVLDRAYVRHRFSLFSYKKIIFGASIFVVGLAAVSIFLMDQHASGLVHAIESGFFHLGLDPGIPAYSIWNVLPILILPFAALGIYTAARKRLFTILFPAIIGLLGWIFYAYYPNVIIIEYPRIVAMTSFLLVALAGAGMDMVIDYLVAKHPIFAGTKAESIIAAVVIIAFFVPVFWYPFNGAWQKLVLKVPDQNGTYDVYPAAPLNRYLTTDDQALWRGIHGSNFIAPPWKGLVLGVSTDNRPLQTKSSFLGVDTLSYDEFMAGACADKSSLAVQFSVSYVYSAPFDCAGFAEMGSSSEGLHLYRSETPSAIASSSAVSR